MFILYVGGIVCFEESFKLVHEAVGSVMLYAGYKISSSKDDVFISHNSLLGSKIY